MQIRVYDRNQGDFILEVPDDAEITFGYFNPASPNVNQRNAWSQGPGAETMRTTALRIYTKNGKTKTQIACFLGVDGYRDVGIKLKRVVEKVTVTTSLADDGEGTVDYRKGQKRETRLALEPGYRANDEDIPF